MNKIQFRSRKEVSEFLKTKGIDTSNWSEIKWLQLNTGQAEIHMMALAEAMWDAMNESKPKQLEAGEWHIPFEDKITIPELHLAYYKRNNIPLDYATIFRKETMDKLKVEVSTAMAARTSYTVVGNEKEVSYETLIGIHDKMAVARPFHASPFEHCAKAMSDEEYQSWYRGEGANEDHIGRQENHGWCRNYRGFIQYRHILESHIQM